MSRGREPAIRYRTIPDVGRQCTVCGHQDRAAIDEQLLLGVLSVSTIGVDHGLSDTALKRHRDNHLAEALAGAVVTRQERAAEGPRKALSRLEDLTGRVETLLDTAEAAGQVSTALGAVRELRSLLELVAKITGELNERPQLAVFQLSASPDWALTRDTIFAALVQYPEARAVVAAALADVPALQAASA